RRGRAATGIRHVLTRLRTVLIRLSVVHVDAVRIACLRGLVNAAGIDRFLIALFGLLALLLANLRDVGLRGGGVLLGGSLVVRALIGGCDGLVLTGRRARIGRRGVGAARAHQLGAWYPAVTVVRLAFVVHPAIHIGLGQAA